MNEGPTIKCDANEPLVFTLMRALEWFNESTRLTTQALGIASINMAQALLLGQIARGEHRPARLARLIGMSRQSVSLLVTQLERAGVLTIKADPEDARAIWVDFAPEHSSQRDAVLCILGELERHVGELIGTDRLAVLRHALGIDWGPPLTLEATRLNLAGSTEMQNREFSRE